MRSTFTSNDTSSILHGPVSTLNIVPVALASFNKMENASPTWQASFMLSTQVMR